MEQLLQYHPIKQNHHFQNRPLHKHHNRQQNVDQSYFLPRDEDCDGRPWAVTRVSLPCLRVSPRYNYSLTTQ